MKRIATAIVIAVFLLLCAEGCGGASSELLEHDGQFETATLGAGCFWCTEAIFQRLKGVQRVESGYSGGTVENPSSKQVNAGGTGHAQVVQITFDTSVISFKELLDVFWKTHDPTTLNRQGEDAGPQYRSVIFYHSDEQRKIAEEYKRELQRAKVWNAPIVTEIAPYTNFYLAEEYHQNFYNNHENNPYCISVINPKLKKFQKDFQSKLTGQ